MSYFFVSFSMINIVVHYSPRKLFQVSNDNPVIDFILHVNYLINTYFLVLYHNTLFETSWKLVRFTLSFKCLCHFVVVLCCTVLSVLKCESILNLLFCNVFLITGWLIVIFTIVTVNSAIPSVAQLAATMGTWRCSPCA